MFLAKALNSGRLRIIYFMTPASRVPFDRLMPVMLVLEQSLVSGEINIVQYNDAWIELLQATGWTDATFAAEVDSRWSSTIRPEESFTC
jgi:hypothetical protein